MSDAPPPGGYPPQDPYQPPQQPYQPPPAAPQQPAYQPPPAAPQPPPQPQYQPPPQPQFQQPQYAQPGQFQPVNPPAKSGNGCLKAFLIVMVISIVLGIGGTILFVAVIGKAVNDNFGTADPKDYTVAITDGTCSIDSLGYPSVSGTLKNTSGSTHIYRLTVDFSTTDNVKIDTSPFVTTPSLSPNETGNWSGSSFTSAKGKDITCSVSKVEYFGS